MAKILRIGRKLARIGGKLVLDTGGAPCCCDQPPPANLLEAVPCSPCCDGYDQGLPVDADAVPGWETRPVFYIHGRCWQVIGPWLHDPPPEWLIVRRVYDFLRYADCPSCIFDNPECPILAPLCETVSPMPNEYEVRLRSVGRAYVPPFNNKWYDWNATTITRITSVTKPCRPGCYTGGSITAGTIISHVGDTFHGTIGTGDARFESRFSGWLRAYDRGVLTQDWPALDALRIGTAYGVHLGLGHRTLGGNSQAYSVWHFEPQGSGLPGPTQFSHGFGSESHGPWFWAKGGHANVGQQQTDIMQITVNGLDGFTLTGIADIDWSLRPISYCCNDAPPPDGGIDDTDTFGGVGGSSSGGSVGGGVSPASDPNAAAIEQAMSLDPMRRCRGCGG